ALSPPSLHDALPICTQSDEENAGAGHDLGVGRAEHTLVRDRGRHGVAYPERTSGGASRAADRAWRAQGSGRPPRVAPALAQQDLRCILEICQVLLAHE